jgi:hypothetical protein
VASIFKLSNQSVATPAQAHYDDMLAGNATFIPSNFYSISTVTVGSGGQSSVTFSSIPQTYTHLQIRATALSSGTYTANDIFRFNGDSGSNYATHSLYGNGSSAAASALINQTSIPTSVTPGATYPFCSIIDILDYSNTNKYKTIRVLAGGDQNNTNGYIFLDSGLWMSTAAVTSITWQPNTGNWNQYSSFALYGVR